MTQHRFRLPLLPGLLAWLLAAGLPAAEPAGADPEVASPEHIEGVQKVDAETLIEMYGSTPDLVLVDSRISADRKQGYIEGSISLPDTETDCATLARVAPATNSPLLFYCNGIRCGRSARAARIAIDCGYSDVYWYRNGIEAWRQKEYPLVQ